MNSAKNIALSKFPLDDKYWRVDWKESVPTKLASSEPLLTAFLTRVNECSTDQIDPLVPSSIYKSYSVPPSRIEVPFGVGHQSLVNIGSVWKNQVNVSQGYTYTVFSNIKIDTSEAVPITFQHKSKQGKRILSASQYPTGAITFGRIKNSTLIAIPYDGDDCGLIIPAAEIIRFYYLISSKMSLALYQGQFDKLVVERETIFVPETRHVEFTLNWGVNVYDVPIIARYLSSEVMQERVSEIFDWLRTNSINKEEIKSTTTFFPFDEKTNLSFEGILVRGDDNKQRILCTRLITCSGPFNYDQASASKILSETKGVGTDPEITINAPMPTYWNIPFNEPIEIDIEEEPSKRHVTKAFVTLENRFEGLANKSINIGKVTYQSNRTKKIKYDKSDTKRKVSTSSGTFGASNSRKVNVVVNLGNAYGDSPLPTRLKSFIKVLNFLRDEGYTVKSLPVKLPEKYEGKRGYPSVTTSIIENEIVIGCFKVIHDKSSWVNINIHGESKPRGMMIAQVGFGKKSIYLFELEQDFNKSSKENYSVLIQYKSDFSEFINEDLYNFIWRCGENKGWSKIYLEDDLVTVIKTRINHTDGMEERILNLIQHCT